MCYLQNTSKVVLGESLSTSCSFQTLKCLLDSLTTDGISKIQQNSWIRRQKNHRNSKES